VTRFFFFLHGGHNISVGVAGQPLTSLHWILSDQQLVVWLLELKELV